MNELNILVNGKRCKTYLHNGKVYIEGKDGSEYEIEVKNNSGIRIESVASVDGLSVMSGKPASDNQGGYVIDPYSSYKIKGFRYSDNRVGAFRFSYKNQSYAKSKGDGSEINCGVIACKMFNEKIVYHPPLIKKTLVPRTVWDEVWEYDNTYSGGGSTAVSGGFLPDGGLYGVGRHGYSTSTSDTMKCSGNVTARSMNLTDGPSLSYCSEEPSAEVFNLGTEWGSDKESRVVSTTFTRDVSWSTFEIYYTDRQGLIDLGIPLSSLAKINFPESFPGNYAEPPVGWKR